MCVLECCNFFLSQNKSNYCFSLSPALVAETGQMLRGAWSLCMTEFPVPCTVSYERLHIRRDENFFLLSKSFFFFFLLAQREPTMG